MKNVDGSAKILTNVQTFGTVHFSGMFAMSTHNEHSTDAGHSPETSGHLLRLWHFHQYSSLSFLYTAISKKVTLVIHDA